MLKRKLIKLIKVNNLAEIFQSIDIKFAFVNDKMEQVSVPAKCRDFLGDCLWSKATGKNVDIWSFIYNYKETPYSDSKLRLSLKFPDMPTKEVFLSHIDYLHTKEKQAGTSLTKVFNTQEEDTLLIESSKYWQSAVWKISLFTYYLKVMSNVDMNNLTVPENTYAAAMSQAIEEKLLAKIKGRKVTFSESLKTNHDYSGFYSLIKKTHGVDPQTYNYVFGK